MTQTSDVNQSQENISKSTETREQTVKTPNPTGSNIGEHLGRWVFVCRDHGTRDLMDVELCSVDAFKYHTDFMRFRVVLEMRLGSIWSWYL